MTKFLLVSGWSKSQVKSAPTGPPALDSERWSVFLTLRPFGLRAALRLSSGGPVGADQRPKQEHGADLVKHARNLFSVAA